MVTAIFAYKIEMFYAHDRRDEVAAFLFHL
jgi:hypothetical protein